MSATAWDGSQTGSTARLNKMTIPSDTGTNLATYNKSKFAIVVCTNNGDVFIKDHVYLFGVDGTTVVDLTDVDAHTHHDSTNGGSIYDILATSPELFNLTLTRPTDMIKANWNQTVTGTGSIEDSAGNPPGGSSKFYIRLRPNGTSGSGATISYTHATNLTFTEPSMFISVNSFETASSLAFHAGVNADDVTAADSNTIKYQAEVCTTTNNNWWLRTANGSANSASDTGVAISTSTTSVQMKHDPTIPNVVMKISSGSAFTKTTDIPTTGSTTTGNLVKFSQKNNTAADRPARVQSCRLIFKTTDSWGYG